MYRGSTPTYNIYLQGMRISDLTDLQITFTQRKEVVIEKTLADMTVDTDANCASFSLTQAETMALDVGLVDKQIRVKNTSGQVTLTRIFREQVKPNVREDLINA